jgi:hypothetical protein
VRAGSTAAVLAGPQSAGDGGRERELEWKLSTAAVKGCELMAERLGNDGEDWGNNIDGGGSQV